MSEKNRDCVVYKVLPGPEWDAACRKGVFEGSSDDLRDGFIHLSSGGQLAATLLKYFCGQTGLVLVAFKTASLGETLKWEVSRGGALFPHLYGNLATDKALWLRELELARNGRPIIPSDVEIAGEAG